MGSKNNCPLILVGMYVMQLAVNPNLCRTLNHIIMLYYFIPYFREFFSLQSPRQDDTLAGWLSC